MIYQDAITVADGFLYLSTNYNLGFVHDKLFLYFLDVFKNVYLLFIPFSLL